MSRRTVGSLLLLASSSVQQEVGGVHLAPAGGTGEGAGGDKEIRSYSEGAGGDKETRSYSVGGGGDKETRSYSVSRPGEGGGGDQETRR